VRLVGLRLDKIEKAIDLAQAQIAERETAKLRRQISQLPQSSVIIKEAAAALARLFDANFWIPLNQSKARIPARRDQTAVPHRLRGRLQGHAL
jgi:type I restriction enzyme R subunit